MVRRNWEDPKNRYDYDPYYEYDPYDYDPYEEDPMPEDPYEKVPTYYDELRATIEEERRREFEDFQRDYAEYASENRYDPTEEELEEMRVAAEKDRERYEKHQEARAKFYAENDVASKYEASANSPENLARWREFLKIDSTKEPPSDFTKALFKGIESSYIARGIIEGPSETKEEPATPSDVSKKSVKDLVDEIPFLSDDHGLSK